MTTAEPTKFESFRAEDVHVVDVAQIIAILDLQARVPAFQKLKSWALSALDPQPGEVAVDIGSGTGEDVQALASLVGTTGHAVGVELNPGLRDEAARRAEAAGSAARFVDGDALALPFEDGSVDVVRSERVFQHLSDPHAAAREIARVLRPGGRVALIDTDWTTASLHPIPDDMAVAMERLYSQQFPNPLSGRKLREYLARAGLTPTDATAETWLQDQTMASRPPASLIGPQAASKGVITADQGQRLTEALAQAGDQGWFHMSLTMFAASAVKPG